MLDGVPNAHFECCPQNVIFSVPMHHIYIDFLYDPATLDVLLFSFPFDPKQFTQSIIHVEDVSHVFPTFV